MSTYSFFRVQVYYLLVPTTYFYLIKFFKKLFRAQISRIYFIIYFIKPYFDVIPSDLTNLWNIRRLFFKWRIMTIINKLKPLECGRICPKHYILNLIYDYKMKLTNKGVKLNSQELNASYYIFRLLVCAKLQDTNDILQHIRYNDPDYDDIIVENRLGIDQQLFDTLYIIRRSVRAYKDQKSEEHILQTVCESNYGYSDHEILKTNIILLNKSIIHSTKMLWQGFVSLSEEYYLCHASVRESIEENDESRLQARILKDLQENILKYLLIKLVSDEHCNNRSLILDPRTTY